MNVTVGLAYLKRGLVASGLREQQVLTSMEMARPANRDNAPSASVYILESRLRRQGRKERVQASEVQPPMEGAVGGTRHTLAGGLNWFEVLIAQRSMAATENVLARFVEYLITHPLMDAAGNTYDVLRQGNERETELLVLWNDHDAQDRVECTLHVPLPAIVWRDHPLLPVEIVVEYRLEGGNPDE